MRRVRGMRGGLNEIVMAALTHPPLCSELNETLRYGTLIPYTRHHTIHIRQRTKMGE